MELPYAEISEELRDLISVRLNGNPEDRGCFAAKGTAKEVLTNSLLRRFFKSLDLSEHSTARLDELSEDRLLRRIAERDLYDFLATLIHIACNIHAARAFVTELLAKDNWYKDLHSLPVERNVLDSLFNHQITTNKFLGSQACFCAIVIRKAEKVVIQNNRKRLLPYLDEKRIGEGSYGRVYKVKIATGHFYDPEMTTLSQEPMVMVRKDYKVDPRATRTPEHEILKKIFSAVNQCRNIVPIWGFLATGVEDYSLFMPQAHCDLWHYMTQDTPRAADKLGLIRAARGLANGLNFLHNGIKDGEFTTFNCYHMDLKPNNILVFLEKVDDKTVYVWKISDFGLSKIKRSTTDETASSASRGDHFDSIFAQRPLQDTAGASSRRQAATYGAPESLLPEHSMGSESDVWSLGCIISILFVYLEKGADGVNLYSDERVAHPRSDAIDRFFIRERLTSYQVNPAVRKRHSALIAKARARDRLEGDAVRTILDFLENDVFIHHTRRANAKLFKKKLKETYDKYQGLTYPPSDASPNTDNRSIRDILNIFHPKDCNRMIKQEHPICILQEKKPFKGCDIAPDGSAVVLWTDFQLSFYSDESLYRAESLHPTEQDRLPPVASAAKEHYIEHSIWKSVSVTHRYLVASVSSASFECYKFDLLSGSFDPEMILLEELPEIKQLAISPDSETVVFILRDRDDEENQGSLYSAPIRNIGNCRYQTKLDWPAADTVQLLFTTENDLWVISRPDQERKIPIFHVCLHRKTLNPLVIRIRQHDILSTAGVFTALAPFNTMPDKCAVVTRCETLYIQSLAAGSSIPITANIRNYSILRIMMACDDKHLFAVGKIRTKYKMLLLEITLPTHRERHVSIKERAVLSGLSEDDDFAERLTFEREDDSPRKENLIVLVAFTKQKGRVVYRIRI